MKKKFKFSLDLNKETVSELTKKQQRTIFGGESDACGPNSTDCPEVDVTQTCECPNLPTNIGCGYTFHPGLAGCAHFTTITYEWPNPCIHAG